VICPSGGIVESAQEIRLCAPSLCDENFLRLTPPDARIEPDAESKMFSQTGLDRQNPQTN